MRSTLARELPDPAVEPTIGVARAAAIVDISTRHGYVAVERGDWPSIRVGRSIRIPTARWLRTIGLIEEPAISDGQTDATPVTSADTGASHMDLTARRRSRSGPGSRRRDPEVA